ncbi:MAG: 4Fe-4S dicluster domain-containing protein [Chloroflexi bacterium]|nr:4Fe-4S dicluster domain-containing protein [Chloroflexota bacterium]
MGIKTIDEGTCTGCAICVASCPMDVIRMTPDRRKAAIRYPLDCMTCYNCERDCPEEGTITIGPERARYVPLPW